jgi:copper chaperone
MGQSTTYTFAIDGMHCASCGMLIDDAVEDLPGVTTSTTNLRKQRSVVTVDPTVCSPEQVIAAIAGAGSYTARIES